MLTIVDPKCRCPAIGTYTHALDQWAIAYDQPSLLATAGGRRVALEPIRDGWEELLHLAASIEPS